MAARKKRGKRRSKRTAKRTVKHTAKRKVAKKKNARRVVARTTAPQRKKASKRSRSAKAAHKRRKAAAAARGGVLSYFGRKPTKTAEEWGKSMRDHVSAKKSGKKNRSPWSSFRNGGAKLRVRNPEVALSRYGRWSRKLADADWAPPGMERAQPVRVMVADPRFGGHEFSD